MKVYAKDSMVAIVGEDLELILTHNDLKLSSDALKSQLNSYGCLYLSKRFDRAQTAGVTEEDLLIDLTPLEYIVGKKYLGKQLIDHPLPNGSIILDPDNDPLKYYAGSWYYGNTQLILGIEEKHTLLYLEED